MPKPEASIKLQKDLEYTAAHCRRGGAAPSCRESSLSSNCKTACGRIIPVWTDEYRSGLQKISAAIKITAGTMGYVV